MNLTIVVNRSKNAHCVTSSISDDDQIFQRQT